MPTREVSACQFTGRHPPARRHAHASTADDRRPHDEEIENERGDTGDERGPVGDGEQRPDEQRREQEKQAERSSFAFTAPAGSSAAGARRPAVPRGRLRRATPVLMAASATAVDTAGTTRGSNIDGVMYSSLSSLFATMPASACAAASFISSFTRRARTSSMPRKKPGKQHELLIWFG